MRRVVIFGIFRPFMDVVQSLAVALLLWYGEEISCPTY